MKIGDLVRYRHPNPDDKNAIALVVNTTSHPDVFEVLELSGLYKGDYNNVRDEDWEVISESG
tara:strand:+ start:207 stop:392 length:186 start_codon:yes stop_codon:yes gene_type:complete